MYITDKDDKIEITQVEYEKVFNEMRKLNRKQILAGCKVFEIEGMNDNIAECFLFCVFGGEIGWCTTAIKDNKDDVFPNIYRHHWFNPELVFLVACELLG